MTSGHGNQIWQTAENWLSMKWIDVSWYGMYPAVAQACCRCGDDRRIASGRFAGSWLDGAA